MCCQYARTSPHTPRAGQGILPASVTTSKTPTMARTQQTGPARRLPDVNKHSSVLPSKGSSHCCGQRCLPCVMLDEMAGNVLAVLMYIGAFRDLLRGCGGKGACVQPHSSAPIDQSRVSKQFGDAVSEDFFFFLFFLLPKANGQGDIYI